MSEAILIRTTVPSRELARRIAEELLSRHLAASVHVSGPTESSYWWQGEIRHAEEWTCEIRTLERAREQVESAVRRLHPYELPEIFALPMGIADPRLVSWLRDAVPADESRPSGDEVTEINGRASAERRSSCRERPS